ncbi:MAG: hypothetical protein ACE5G2_05505 [Candidatus Krumholzibacteriia bacterium]
MRPRLRRAVANLALLTVSLIVAFFLFELGVRILEPQPEARYRFSPYTYYEPVPGAEFVYERIEFSVPVSFNGFGMRDAPRELEKPAGRLRVTVLGDSYAEALQVPADSTTSRLLERELRRRHPGRDIEVLNFGVSGFGTVASAVRYQVLVSRFRPDLVVYLFVSNDPWDVLSRDARLYEVRDGEIVFRTIDLGPARRAVRYVADFMKHHFHTYRFLKYRLLVRNERRAREEARDRATVAGTDELLPGDAAWERMRMALQRLRDDVSGDGARLLVAQATTRGPDMDARLAGLCRELEIPFRSLVPALRADPGPVHFRFDGHWRARGHDIAAREIADLLADHIPAPRMELGGSLRETPE